MRYAGLAIAVSVLCIHALGDAISPPIIGVRSSSFARLLLSFLFL